MVAPVTFIRQTIDELKQVTWPTRDEVVRLTLVVLVISVIVGVYIGGIDFALTALTEAFLK
jgi:preprotein translocase subunit SecE